MRTLAVLLAGAVLATGSAAAAAEPAEAPAPKAKKICKKAATPVGSRLGAKMICATKEEWQAYVEPGKGETRNNFDLIQRRGLVGG
jgi:hypothetical protein